MVYPNVDPTKKSYQIFFKRFVLCVAEKGTYISPSKHCL